MKWVFKNPQNIECAYLTKHCIVYSVVNHDNHIKNLTAFFNCLITFGISFKWVFLNKFELSIMSETLDIVLFRRDGGYVNTSIFNSYAYM